MTKEITNEGNSKDSVPHIGHSREGGNLGFLWRRWIPAYICGYALFKYTLLPYPESVSVEIHKLSNQIHLPIQ